MAKPLKPCPFCGKDAVLSYKDGKYGMFGFIKCSICQAQTHTTKIMEPWFFDTEIAFWGQRAWLSVVHAWNTRTTIPDEDEQ